MTARAQLPCSSTIRTRTRSPGAAPGTKTTRPSWRPIASGPWASAVTARTNVPGSSVQSCDSVVDSTLLRGRGLARRRSRGRFFARRGLHAGEGLEAVHQLLEPPRHLFAPSRDVLE